MTEQELNDIDCDINLHGGNESISRALLAECRRLRALAHDTLNLAITQSGLPLEKALTFMIDHWELQEPPTVSIACRYSSELCQRNIRGLPCILLKGHPGLHKRQCTAQHNGYQCDLPEDHKADCNFVSP